MRESFIFYSSFFEAIVELDDKKQLKLYKAIAEFALKNIEPTNLQGIEKAIFALIKPQISANNKRYEDGKKGGRPKKKITSGFENKKTTGYDEKKPNVNVNVNDNVNENVNVNVNDNVNGEVLNSEEKEIKKTDPYINNIEQYFSNEYKHIMGNKPYLTAQQKQKLMELNAEIEGFKETIPEAIKRLKDIKFNDINFTPTASWLLKNDNYTSVMNGEYNPKKTIWDELREKEHLENDKNGVY